MTTINLSKNMDPNRFDVSIIHTDFMPVQRLDQSVIDSLPDFIELTQIKSSLNRLRNSLIGRVRHIPLGKVWETLFFAPLFWPIIAFEQKVKEWNTLKDSDIIYLADNVDMHLFGKFKGKIVGSNQGMFENPNSVYTRLVVRFISSNFILKKICAYHLFPMNAGLVKRFVNKKCAVIPPGLESDQFQPIPHYKKDRPVRVLFIASLEEFKGISLAIEAFNKISENYNVEFNIGGGGPLKDLVKRAASLNEKISYHGVLTSEQVREFYGTSDIFLYPSLGETFGLVVLEAVSSGMDAIIGENLKGNFDELAELGHISYCEYDSNKISEILRKKIENLSSSHEKRQRKHDYVASNYDWKIVTEKFMDFLEDVANGE